MRLIIRTVNNIEATIEASEGNSVSEIKEKVEAAISHFSAVRQVLIHQGRILNDSMKLTDYPDIKDGSKLIVILTAPKQPTASRPTETSAGQTGTTTTTTTTTTNVPAVQSSSAAEPSSSVLTPTPSCSSTPPAPSPPSDLSSEPSINPLIESQPEQASVPAAPESSLVVGQELEETINNICAMGFQRNQVVRALHAAFNNPDRAVEYLMTGIPNSPTSRPSNTLPPVTTGESNPLTVFPPTPADTPAPAAAPGTATAGGRLDVLRNHPLFEQIRSALQANPQLLPGMLQMIGQQNPELAELIMTNQNEFLQMMSEGNGRSGAAAGPAEPNNLGGSFTIQVTPEQQEKIRHLEALGFPESGAVQALIVCDWDEDRAANFLFDNAGDFDEGDEGEGELS